VFKLKEIQILKTLDHPNILKCFEIFEDTRYFYVATEHCPAGDLFSQIINLNHFTDSKAAEIMLQLLSALSYCHENRVIHRDLKPENILLMESGDQLSIKVADFGSSAFLDPLAKLSGCFGSAYYLAPEVFSGSYNEKCDIWSLGIIMYILITGKPPYPGRDPETIMKYARVSPFVLTTDRLQGISKDAGDLLKKLLKIKPDQRISAKDALKHHWFQITKTKIVPDTQIVLENLKNFNTKAKLKEAVHIFIASQIASYDDLKFFKDCFVKIDLDGDGKLNKEELVEEYCKNMPREQAEALAQSIVLKLDQDADGKIDYTEFLTSCLEKQKNLSIENLEIAFRMFDVDGNGSITAEELRAVLSDGLYDDEDLWKLVLNEADGNGDGIVDIKEFMTLMSAVKSIGSFKSTQNPNGENLIMVPSVSRRN
jgi:calcium-dependent protein kinase